MKKQIDTTIALFLLFSFTVYSQSVSERFDTFEKEINRKSRIDRQESLNLLKQMYAICHEYPDSTTFYARTLLAETEVNEYQGIRDSLLLKTIHVRLENKNATSQEEVILKSALARTYYTLGDLYQTFDISLDLLNHAKQLKDSFFVANALNILGNSCQITELYAMAEEYYLGALAWATHKNNIYYSIKINLYSHYLRREIKNESAIYKDSMLVLIKEMKDIGADEFLPPLYINISNAFIGWDECYIYLEKARKLYIYNPHKYALVSNNIGLYYLTEKHDREKALENFRIAQNIWEETNYYGLGQVYKNIGNVYREAEVLDSALFYIDKASEIEKLYENNRQIIETNRKHILSLLGVSESKLALAKSETELKNRQLAITLISTIVIAIAAILLFLLFRQKRRRMQQEVLRKEAETKAKSEQLENKLREVTSYSLLLANKNNILSRIKEINDLRAKKGTNELEIKKQIDKLVKSNLNTDEYWNDFVVHFTEVNPKFFKSLQERFPDITRNELKLCAYIRMGMSTKQIAQILNITYASVNMNRYRLRKKLDLSNDDSLDDFIRNI